jgi:phytoene dehydrogenase-like protein
MIDGFFRPFFGGVFLEDELETSSRWFELLFRLFSTGSASLPAAGMQAIPEQLAAGLHRDWLRTGVRVSEVGETWVRCASGEQIAASAVVVATDQPAAQELVPAEDRARFRSVTCLYYAAPEPPIRDPVLVLNGNRGVINNLCVPSVLSRAYAPEGQELISVTVLARAANRYGGPGDTLDEAVRQELRDWFGACVDSWTSLRSYQIDTALPAQGPGDFQPRRTGVELRRGAYLCGDYLQTSSIQGAMVSGRKAAAALIERARGSGSSQATSTASRGASGRASP